MIVVSRARRLVGHDIESTIASVLQTAAGRMAFAEVVNGKREEQSTSLKPGHPPKIGAGLLL